MANANTNPNQPGWRKAYLGLLNTVTILFIIGGSLWHLFGGIGRGFFGGAMGGIFSGNSAGRNVYSGSRSDEEALEPFSEIWMDIATGGVEIIRGSEYRISCQGYPSGKEPEWNVQGGVLTVTQAGSGNGLLSGECAGNNRKITLTIPEGALLRGTSLTLSMGGLSLKNLSLGDTDIFADMGSVEIKSCTASGLDITASMGEIHVAGSEFAQGYLDADMGEVDVEDSQFQSGIFSSNMGSVTLENVTFASAECYADMGGIEVSGDFESLTADVSMGGITVTCGDDARLNLSTDMGGIKVNGKSQGSSFTR